MEWMNLYSCAFLLKEIDNLFWSVENCTIPKTLVIVPNKAT